MEVSTNGEKLKTTSAKKRVIVSLVIILFILAAVLGFWLFLKKKHEPASGMLGYESGAVTVTDESTLQDAVDEMMAKEGQMALEYRPLASSPDGRNFSGHIVNSVKNKYDMYLGIYADEGLKDELYLTQLIKPGDGIETFSTARDLEEGTHSCVLVFTQVEEDHQTIHSQVQVVYTLSVNKNKSK